MKRLALCFVLVGCGGDGSGDNGTTDLDNLGLELVTASCAKQFECCTDAEIMASYMGITIDDEPITTEEQCVSIGNALFTTYGVALYKESLAVGRIEYDGEAAADCVAALERVTCDEYETANVIVVNDGCRQFVIPTVAEGGACTYNHQCTTRNCVGEDASPDEGPPVDGACQPMPGLGEPCDGNCADGHYCAYDLAAAMDVCKATKADGMECSLDRDCTSELCDDTTRLCASPAPTCDGR